jgi:hypothetical protein
MRHKFTIAQKVWGEFHGEQFSGSFSYEAGTHVARTAGEEELFEHLVGLGLAARAKRTPASRRPSPAQTITSEV